MQKLAATHCRAGRRPNPIPNPNPNPVPNRHPHPHLHLHPHPHPNPSPNPNPNPNALPSRVWSALLEHHHERRRPLHVGSAPTRQLADAAGEVVGQPPWRDDLRTGGSRRRLWRLGSAGDAAPPRPSLPGRASLALASAGQISREPRPQAPAPGLGPSPPARHSAAPPPRRCSRCTLVLARAPPLDRTRITPTPPGRRARATAIGP